MRKQIITLLAGAMLAVCSMLTISTPASAYSVDGAYVGGVDTFMASIYISPPNPTNEVAWVNTILGTSFTATDLVKTDMGSGGLPWGPVDENSRIVAFNLQDTPSYFYIKTGNLQVTGDNEFLFQNVAELDWAVVNLDDFGGNIIKEFGQFSHVGELGGTTPPVPEPGTMMLLGVGLFGLAVYGKRRTIK